MTTEPATPRPAATLICIRDGAAGSVEALMTVRHQAMAFGSGALVFPGGRVEAGDRDIAAAPAELCDPASRDLAPDELALRIAAIRETFEESGLLLATAAGTGEAVDDSRLQSLVSANRAKLCGGDLAWGAFLAREGLCLATGALVRFAHWVTPKARPKRFDIHFYLARAPEGQVEGHDGGEAVESVWIAPERAIAETAAGRYKLLFATRMNLVKLGMSPTVEEALAAARRSDIVTVEPDWVVTAAGEKQIRIPAAAGYGGDLFPAIDPPAM